MTKDKSVIGIYMDANIRQTIERIAEKENRSLSNQVLTLVSEALESRAEKAGIA